MTDNAPKPNNRRTNKRTPRRGPRTISTNVGKVYLEADAEKRRKAAEAMARMSRAK